MTTASESTVRELLSPGPPSDCLDAIEREVACDAYALAVKDIVEHLRDPKGLAFHLRANGDDFASLIERRFRLVT